MGIGGGSVLCSAHLPWRRWRWPLLWGCVLAGSRRLCRPRICRPSNGFPRPSTCDPSRAGSEVWHTARSSVPVRCRSRHCRRLPLTQRRPWSHRRTANHLGLVSWQGSNCYWATARPPLPCFSTPCGKHPTTRWCGATFPLPISTTRKRPTDLTHALRARPSTQRCEPPASRRTRRNPSSTWHCVSRRWGSVFLPEHTGKGACRRSRTQPGERR